jgi:hypothetical protein
MSSYTRCNSPRHHEVMSIVTSASAFTLELTSELTLTVAMTVAMTVTQ